MTPKLEPGENHDQHGTLEGSSPLIETNIDSPPVSILNAVVTCTNTSKPEQDTKGKGRGRPVTVSSDDEASSTVGRETIPGPSDAPAAADRTGIRPKDDLLESFHSPLLDGHDLEYNHWSASSSEPAYLAENNTVTSEKPARTYPLEKYTPDSKPLHPFPDDDPSTTAEAGPSRLPTLVSALQLGTNSAVKIGTDIVRGVASKVHDALAATSEHEAPWPQHTGDHEPAVRPRLLYGDNRTREELRNRPVQQNFPYTAREIRQYKKWKRHQEDRNRLA